MSTSPTMTMFSKYTNPACALVTAIPPAHGPRFTYQMYGMPTPQLAALASNYSLPAQSGAIRNTLKRR